MPRYFLEFSFSGTHYSGWQIQENAISVQQKVNEALSTIACVPVETIGCGRTDTGVHAKQFFAHFDWKEIVTDKYRFLHQLNGMLPHDIAMHDLHDVKEGAHARFDAFERTYEYYAYRKKNVFLKNNAAAFYFDLDIALINKACIVLFEYDDFNCFAKNRSDVKDTICKIKKAEWQTDRAGGRHQFTITANRFLRGMVRAIVGTLVQVGKEEITVDDFHKIIEGKNRMDAGASVPACGLYLSGIKYPFLEVKSNFEFPFDVK